MEIILLVATVLGGVAALWFFWDKLGVILWKQERDISSPICLYEKIISEKKTTIDCISNPPLIDYKKVGSSTHATGLYAEIIKNVAIKHKVRLEFVPLQLSEVVDAVLNGKVDFSLCSFKTAERAPLVDFTAFLHSVLVGGIVQRSQKKIRSRVDLAKDDVKVVVNKGGIGSEIARHDYKIGKERLIEIATPDIFAIVALVQTGQADIAIANAISCHHYLNEYDLEGRLEYMFKGHPLGVCPVGVMMPKNQPKLSEWLDAVFKQARNEPDIQANEEKILNEYSGLIVRIY